MMASNLTSGEETETADSYTQQHRTFGKPSTVLQLSEAKFPLPSCLKMFHYCCGKRGKGDVREIWVAGNIKELLIIWM